MSAIDLTPLTQPLALAPALLRSVVAGRPDEWLDRKHAEDVFSPRFSVAHLVLCERDWSWVDRAKRILDPAHSPEGTEEQSEQHFLDTHTLPELLDEFERLRFACINELEAMNLTEEDLGKQASPTGSTLGELLNTWVAHDLYHIGQMFKSYAAPYQGQIGPYQKYLNLPHFN